MNYLIKVIHLAWRGMRKNKADNLIILAFVLTAIFFMNISISTFRYLRYINGYINECGLYEKYMYVGFISKEIYIEENTKQKAANYVRECLENLKQEGTIEGFYRIDGYGTTLDGSYCKVIETSGELLRELSFPVSSGKWFDQCECSGDYIPVVVGYNIGIKRKVGETLELSGTEKSGLVVGVLKRGAYFINPNASGSGINLNNITQQADNCVIAAVDSVDELSSGSMIIKISDFSESELQDAKEKVLSLVADVTNTFSFSNLADEAYEENLYAYQMHTTLAVLSMLVCVIGLSCKILLSFVQECKRYKIYHICGMDEKMDTSVMLAESVFKLFVPTVLGGILFWRYCVKQEYSYMYVDELNVIVTFIAAAAIFGMVVFIRRGRI